MLKLYHEELLDGKGVVNSVCLSKDGKLSL